MIQANRKRRRGQQSPAGGESQAERARGRGRIMQGHCEENDDLVVRTIACSRAEIVYVKSIVSAYDGLCGLFSDGGEIIKLVAPRGREAELDQLVEDVVEELVARGAFAKLQNSEPRSVAE